MTNHRARYGPHNPDETYVAHEFPEQLVDVGEVQMNYATLGDRSSPALLLIPGQTIAEALARQRPRAMQ